MILDFLSLPQFIALHVGVSLIGISSGLIALPALARGWWVPRTPGDLPGVDAAHQS